MNVLRVTLLLVGLLIHTPLLAQTASNVTGTIKLWGYAKALDSVSKQRSWGVNLNTRESYVLPAQVSYVNSNWHAKGDSSATIDAQSDTTQLSGWWVTEADASNSFCAYAEASTSADLTRNYVTSGGTTILTLKLKASGMSRIGSDEAYWSQQATKMKVSASSSYMEATFNPTSKSWHVSWSVRKYNGSYATGFTTYNDLDFERIVPVVLTVSPFTVKLELNKGSGYASKGLDAIACPPGVTGTIPEIDDWADHLLEVKVL